MFPKRKLGDGGMAGCALPVRRLSLLRVALLLRPRCTTLFEHVFECQHLVRQFSDPLSARRLVTGWSEEKRMDMAASNDSRSTKEQAPWLTLVLNRKLVLLDDGTSRRRSIA
mmetsp:Transcript_11103/g.33275  ORF Transcript_11103/g.33275 Transcript_11103/m.33275 type:complete len:112 (-) Transcript_11103:961-1296(-)